MLVILTQREKLINQFYNYEWTKKYIPQIAWNLIYLKGKFYEIFMEYVTPRF